MQTLELAPKTAALTLPEQPAATPQPLLIYVNVPFCNSKCHFCDWVVHVPIGDLRLKEQDAGRRGHLEALQGQIAVQAPQLRAAGYVPDIMYWGGGTASILTLHEIETVYRSLESAFPLGDVREATIEGSPESLSPEKLRLLRQIGFNRISIGVQAFDQDRLRMIGRAHSADQAIRAVHDAAEAGFDNMNIDLIVGFPDQSVAEVEKTIAQAVSLPVNHFSIYPYRASPGTVLRKQLSRRDNKVNQELQLAAYRRTAEILEEHGHPEYAMSYFGDPRCQSDEAYYQLQMDWIGFGSGANSVINHRFLSNKRGQLHRYNEEPGFFDMDVPAASEPITLYFLSQALTTAEGIDARTFQERTGVPLRTACELPQVRGYLETMNRHGRVLVDSTGIRIHRDDIAQVYIAMNWIDDAPAETE